jgi:hypothetical protein
MALVVGVIFALVCFGVAIKGFISIPEIADAKVAADAHGFAWFWAFLGAIGAAFAGVSWWMVRTHKDEE